METPGHVRSVVLSTHQDTAREHESDTSMFQVG